MSYSSDPLRKHIVNFLYEQNLISSQKFAVCLKEKKLFFGGVSHSKNIKQVLHVDVPLQELEDKNIFVYFTSFQMGTVTENLSDKNHKYKLKLGTLSAERTNIPDDIMQKIVDTFFMDYIKNNQCYQTGHSNEPKIWRFIWCKKEIIGLFPEIKIGLGSGSITIRKDNLFYCGLTSTYLYPGRKEGYCVFRIEKYGGRSESGTVFSLGYPIWGDYLMEYNIDKNNPGYTFYTFGNDKFNVQKKISIFGSFIMILSSIFILLGYLRVIKLENNLN